MPYVKATPAMQAWQKGLSEDIGNLKNFKLSNLITKIPDERTGITTYDINAPYILKNLLGLLNVADPTGIAGFTPGIVLPKSVPSNWAKTYPDYVKMYNAVLNRFKGLNQAAAYTPINFATPSQTEKYMKLFNKERPPMAAYLEGVGDLWGNITHFVEDIYSVPHELLHRWRSYNPYGKQLEQVMSKRINPRLARRIVELGGKPEHAVEEAMVYPLSNLITAQRVPGLEGVLPRTYPLGPPMELYLPERVQKPLLDILNTPWDYGKTAEDTVERYLSTWLGGMK